VKHGKTLFRRYRYLFHQRKDAVIVRCPIAVRKRQLLKNPPALPSSDRNGLDSNKSLVVQFMLESNFSCGGFREIPEALKIVWVAFATVIREFQI